MANKSNPSAERIRINTSDVLARLCSAQSAVRAAANALYLQLPESEEATDVAGILRLVGKELGALLHEIDAASLASS